MWGERCAGEHQASTTGVSTRAPGDPGEVDIHIHGFPLWEEALSIAHFCIAPAECQLLIAVYSGESFSRAIHS